MSGDPPNFYNYRGAALRAENYTIMRELETALGRPIPYLYDEVEIGVASEQEKAFVGWSGEWDEYRDRPWENVVTRDPWRSQLGPGDFAFTTKDGLVVGVAISDAGVGEIPLPVFRLPHLRRLIIHGNKVTRLPPAIGDVANLTILHVGETGIRALPDAIGLLKNLRYLDVVESPVERLPPSVLELPNLAHVVVNTRCLASDPVLETLREQALVEVQFGHFYTPERAEVKGWIADFARRHPRWDPASVYHYLDLAESIVEPALAELRAEGSIPSGGAT